MSQPIAPVRAADRAQNLETVAEAYLAHLRASGIEHLFLNAGTDFAPLVEAYARLAGRNGPALPQPVIAAHENVAIGMAHGAYLMTGAAQAVMVHVGVGTANTVCGLMNAARDRVPIMLTAGRTPIFEQGPLGARDMRIQWGQELFDQAALVRENVKWEYELRDGRQVEAVVDRALDVALAEPRGPVYLTLPREALAAPYEGRGAAASRRASSAVRPDPDAIAALADRLTDAELPVIVAMASGADPETVAPLARLCSRHSIGYVEEQARYLNMPVDHPLHLGHQIAPVLAEADALCLLECDVPWIPSLAAPRAGAFVAECGLDPLFTRYPMRTLASDLSIAASARAVIEALDEALAARADRIDPARGARIAARAEAVRATRQAASAARASTGAPITRDHVADVLGRLLAPEAVVFNEYWAPAPLLNRTRPQTYYFLSPAGGLGWGVPAALGAKLAAPARTIVALVGDGAYMFANPAACHHAAARAGLATLTIVFNNARWGAVDMATRMVYPHGHWLDEQAPSLSDLSPAPAFEMYAQASGGHGERVTRIEDLEPALRRALHEVEVVGRQALVNVVGE
jgi:acetolactate synthase-1/2/3 large subunit